MKSKSLLNLFLIAILFVVISFCLSACNFKKDVIKVEYIVDGASYQTVEYEDGKIALIMPEMIGAYFDGWYFDENFEKEFAEDMVADGITLKLYGKFVYNSFVIEYLLDDILLDTTVFSNLQDIEFATPPLKDGFEFDGWYFNDVLFNSNNVKDIFRQYGKYTMQAKYNCLHNKLSEEYTIGVTCVDSGKIYQDCLTCEQKFYLGDLQPLGHKQNGKFECDDNVHWKVCLRCNSIYDKEEHHLTEVDSCLTCLYYLQDKVIDGSSITTLGRREVIDPKFKNVAGLSTGTLEMVTINIGQGDCIFIKFPDGKTMVMDAGHVQTVLFENNFDRLDNVLIAYNVKQIDYLFLTHSDYDHVRCVEKLLKNYEVKNIYIPKATDKHNSNTYEDVVKAIAKETYLENGVQKNAVVRYNIGDYQIAGDGWRMKCHTYLAKDYPIVTDKKIESAVAIGADKDEIINSLSPVCLLEYAGKTIVLTGDSNQYNEKYLVQRGVFDGVDADILKVAHHGSATSTTEEFLRAVNCEYAIISHGGLFGHPRPEVLARLAETGCKTVFETQSDGNITVKIFGSGALSIDAQNSDDKDVGTSTKNNFQFETSYCLSDYIKRKFALQKAVA